MSPRTALLNILVLASAAIRKSSQNLGNIHRSMKRSHLALVSSRLLPVAISRRYQINDMDNVPIVEAPKNRLGERPGTELPYYWFKVCTRCPKYTWFLRNLEEKEAAAEEAVRTTFIYQVVLKALDPGGGGGRIQHTRN